MTTSIIRNFDNKDIPGITALYNRYIVEGVETFETVKISEKQMEDRLEAVARQYPCLVAEKDGTIAGFCYAHPWKSRAAYSHTLETTIYLAPEFKREGIGTKLMTRLIAECRNAGYRVLIACITASNSSSINFHHRLGFTQVSLFHNVGFKHGKWLDVCDMELQLQP